MDPSAMDHHKRREYCFTRPPYRQGRELKAVKSYTVANESRYLMVFGVPKINLHSEIKAKFQNIGKLEFCNCVTEEWSGKIKLEPFTDVFAVKFCKLEESRRAKRQLDKLQYFGGILHISYAPENETLPELREKLAQRRKEIMTRKMHNESKRAAKATNKK